MIPRSKTFLLLTTVIPGRPRVRHMCMNWRFISATLFKNAVPVFRTPYLSSLLAVCPHLRLRLGGTEPSSSQMPAGGPVPKGAE